MVIKMVLNYKCEVNDFELVCLLTVFDESIPENCRSIVEAVFQPQYTVLVQKILNNYSLSPNGLLTRRP